MGVKTIIHNYDVKVISVPYYEGLTVRDMYDWTSDKPLVLNCLPSEKETMKMPREHIANVIYTKIG